ncbi:MAG TPA: leucyl aminopeptidase family protein [Xanthobacteraceae bacterium]|nr:leucyl aminopeptidase family protein [Xanthobacteraceae bacterium]
MHPIFSGSGAAIPIQFVTPRTWLDVRDGLDAPTRAYVDAAGFEPKAGQHLLLPGPKGLAGVLFAVDNGDKRGRDRFSAGRLPGVLPAGTYRMVDAGDDARLSALAFALGAYRFGRYRKSDPKNIKLALANDVDSGDLSRIVEAVTLARDLINTPTNDMGPSHLEEAARKLAAQHGATVTSTVGGDLVKQRFTLIHAVGRSAVNAPRLIDLTWGNAAHPKVTLVGKGVCFDSGGLDIKPSTGMLMMKKDMGGAAAMLALAHMIMSRGLKVRLRVLIPAVENSIAGDAFRPLDVYSSRKGLTVEIGNTDAEGRLILADALALADEESPELLIDMGTLTGAARVAVGPELVPLYTDDERAAADILRCAAEQNDPMWRMPLWQPYNAMLDSKIADVNNAPSSPFAGSITCALFLKRFVEAAKTWVHLDIYAWVPSAKPGRPEGGECQAARALYAWLCERYS